MLKKYLQELNCTQAQLADKLGLSLAALGKWKERGEIPKSSLIALELLLENERLKRQLEDIKRAVATLKALG